MKGKWIGIIDGTNKGQCILELQEKYGKTEGAVFIYDIKYRSLNAKIEIELKDKKFTGRAYDFKPNSDGSPKEATIKGEILEEGEEINGEWSTDIASKGNMHLFKHKENFVNPMPTAFLSKPINLPACKLDAREFAGLILLIIKDINLGVQPTFTVNYRGASFFKVGIDAFIKDTAIPRIINNMQISVNEYNLGKGYKIVNLNFNPIDGNSAYVSGDNDTWVNGRATEIEDYIKRYQSKTNVVFTKFGPVTNSIIFLSILILLPSLASILARGILVAITVLILLMLNQIYKRWFPKAIIYLGEKEQTFWKRNKDAIFAGLITIFATTVVTFIANYFKNHSDKIFTLFIPQ